MPGSGGRISSMAPPTVRVFTLGRFRVERGGAPLRFGRKAARRPIDLLKLLIAYGGEGVRADRVAEDLWPDAEGDRARAALRTTLSRLRKLIGADAVLGENGALALNPDACWVDALALRERFSETERGHLEHWDEEVRHAAEDALSQYAGDFLPGEEEPAPLISAREKLRGQFFRCLVDLGRWYERGGQSARAMDLYRRGLEVDESSEEVLRAFMRVCRNLGRSGEGVAAYRRCHAALQRRLGLAPSAASQGAYRELLGVAEGDAVGRAPGATALPSVARDTGPAEITVAVLPFLDQSPGRVQQRLADAVRETTISLLGGFPQLSVIAVPHTDTDWRYVRGSEGFSGSSAACYLLQCNVLASVDRIRAIVHLVDARSGRLAWSEQTDHTLGDPIRTCDEVAIRVAEVLVAKLIGGECAGQLLNPNIHVWKTLALARVLLSRHSRQDHLRACALIARVMEVEKQDPFVLGTHASTRVLEGWKMWSARPEASLRMGEHQLRRLEARYGSGAKGLFSLSFACALRGDIDKAVRFARHRIDLEPEDPSPHAFLGVALLYQGRHADALQGLSDAFRVCPQPVHWIYKDHAAAQLCLGRYDDAANTLAKVLVDDYPLHREANLLSVRMLYVASLAGAGRVEQARHEAQATLAAHPLATVRDWCRWHFQSYRRKNPAARVEQLLVAAGLPRQRDV